MKEYKEMLGFVVVMLFILMFGVGVMFFNKEFKLNHVLLLGILNFAYLGYIELVEINES